MKPIHPSKTSYDTLYLIEKEMYDRILPKLNEVDKQELNDLQESYKPYQNSEDSVLEENDQPLSKPQTANKIFGSEINKEEMSPSSNTVNQLSSIPSGKSIKKEKKYACEICVNKMFTTKQSLKRHSKNFHMPKQFIKQNEEPKESDEANHTSPAKKSILKRKFSPEENTASEEPVQKQVKFDLKRKFSDDDDESVREEPVQKSQKLSQGMKRKAPDTLPNKRFRWSSF